MRPQLKIYRLQQNQEKQNRGLSFSGLCNREHFSHASGLTLWSGFCLQGCYWGPITTYLRHAINLLKQTFQWITNAINNTVSSHYANQQAYSLNIFPFFCLKGDKNLKLSLFHWLYIKKKKDKIGVKRLTNQEITSLRPHRSGNFIHEYDLDKTIRKTFTYVLPNCLFYPAGTSNYIWSDLNVQVLL